VRNGFDTTGGECRFNGPRPSSYLTGDPPATSALLASERRL